MNRIPPEHRERIQNLLVDGKLKLVRKYNTDGNSELYVESYYLKIADSN